MKNKKINRHLKIHKIDKYKVNNKVSLFCSRPKKNIQSVKTQGKGNTMEMKADRFFVRIQRKKKINSFIRKARKKNNSSLFTSHSTRKIQTVYTQEEKKIRVGFSLRVQRWKIQTVYTQGKKKY